MRLNNVLGISMYILFSGMYFFFLTSQKFEVHSHEGSMSNMITNTDEQLNIQRKVDPGNLGSQICVCVCVRMCECECVEWSVLMEAKHSNRLQFFDLL